MSMVYREQRQFDQATYYGGLALRLASNDDEKIRIYSNLAYVYNETGSTDSARYYIQLAEKLLNHTDNIFTTSYLAYLSYQIEKNAESYQKALEYFELRSKLYIEILENNDRKLLLEMQRKYDLTSKENELNKQRRQTWQIIGISLMAVLMLVGLFIMVLRNNMKKKEELAKEKIQNTKKQLALEQAEREKMELEQALQQAQTLQDLFHQRDDTMKAKFIEKIEILKKVALLFPLLDEDKLREKNEQRKLVLRTRDVMKELDLQNFTVIANELYPGFTVRLKQMCGKLDDREVSICCLLLFDFSNQELDLFINRRPKGTLSTVIAWKTAIRKKLNIDSHGDIKSFLLEKIVN